MTRKLVVVSLLAAGAVAAISSRAGAAGWAAWGYGRTARPERVAGEMMTKAAQCFNYSEYSLEGRLRVLFWMQRASPCPPSVQSIGAE
jgi:hypothetical protein